MITSSWQQSLVRKSLGLIVVAVSVALSAGCNVAESESEMDIAESESEMDVAEAASALGKADQSDWSLVITTAPKLPQDVWIAAHGNNTDGWNSGGSVCLGVLSNDLGPNDPFPAFQPGDHATLLTTVVAAGVFGVDGTPVAPGDYIAPGLESDASPARAFTLATGQSFYVIFDGKVQNSSEPAGFPFPVGSVLRFMLTFDYTGEGRQIAPSVLWVGVPSGSSYFYFPFLNEGDLMLNARRN